MCELGDVDLPCFLARRVGCEGQAGGLRELVKKVLVTGVGCAELLVQYRQVKLLLL